MDETLDAAEAREATGAPPPPPEAPPQDAGNAEPDPRYPWLAPIGPVSTSRDGTIQLRGHNGDVFTLCYADGVTVTGLLGGSVVVTFCEPYSVGRMPAALSFMRAHPGMDLRLTIEAATDDRDPHADAVNCRLTDVTLFEGLDATRVRYTLAAERVDHDLFGAEVPHAG